MWEVWESVRERRRQGRQTNSNSRILPLIKVTLFQLQKILLPINISESVAYCLLPVAFPNRSVEILNEIGINSLWEHLVGADYGRDFYSQHNHSHK